MTFQSHFAGNTEDRSGTATFKVGDITREIPFADFAQYSAVAQLLNEAEKLGHQRGVREIAAKVAQLAREEEWK